MLKVTLPDGSVREYARRVRPIKIAASKCETRLEQIGQRFLRIPLGNLCHQAIGFRGSLQRLITGNQRFQ